MARLYVSFNGLTFEAKDDETLIWSLYARDAALRWSEKDPWFKYAASQLQAMLDAGLAIQGNFSWYKIMRSPQDVDKAMALCTEVINDLERVGEAVPWEVLRYIETVTHRGILYGKQLPIGPHIKVARTMLALLDGKVDESVLPIVKSPVKESFTL